MYDRINIMDAQLIANIALCIIVLDKIAKATPPDFKIWKLQIGKYDDAVVDLLKDIFSIITTKKAHSDAK